ncbi:MAG: universal stress protein [Bacillota bacterium]
MIRGQLLVATDFSAESRQLIHRAKELKNMGIKEVLLVHVLEDEITDKLGGEEVIEARLSHEASGYEELGFEVKTTILEGEVAEAIQNYTNCRDCPLILIASHGQSFLKDIPIGHTAYNLSRITCCPLLIEKFKNYSDQASTQGITTDDELELVSQQIFERLLLPLDLSPAADRVIDVVKSMKNDITFSQINLLHVIERSSSEEELAELKAEAEKKLVELADYFTKHNVTENIVYSVQTGSASSVITRVAEEEESTMVMLAKAGENFEEQKFLGSTSDILVRELPLPIYLVPPSVYK